MKDRVLRLYILGSCLIFSIGLLERVFDYASSFRPDSGILRGVTGNAAYFNINKQFDLLLYLCALILIPAVTLLGYRLWGLLARFVSGGDGRRNLIARKLVGLPYSVFFLLVPEFTLINFKDRLLLRLLIFLAAMLVCLFLARLRRSAVERLMPALIPAVLFPAVFVSNETVFFLGGLSVSLVSAIFWLYQFGFDSRVQGFRLYAAGGFVLSLALMSVGVAYKTDFRYLIGPYVFLYASAAVYALSDAAGRGRRLLSPRLPGSPDALPFSYHFFALFYGFSAGTFFSLSYPLIAFFSVLFWGAGVFFAVQFGPQANRRGRAYVGLVSLSPIILLHLKAPLYILLFGRHSSGEWLPVFLAVGATLTALAVFFARSFVLRRAAGSGGDYGKAAGVLFIVFFSVVLYALFFDTRIDYSFDYYHEAEQTLRAGLLLGNDPALKDMYLFDHGLIQDLGIGWAAFRLFGETVEGLRLFKMFLNPLGVVVFFLLTVAAFQKRHMSVAAFAFTFLTVLLMESEMLTSPAVHDMVYTPFSTRFMAASAALIFFIEFMRGKRRLYFALTAVAAFVSLLWSLDVGMTLMGALGLVFFILDVKAFGPNPLRHRYFPMFAAIQAVFAALVYVANRDVIFSYLEVVDMQRGVQMLVSALRYPEHRDKFLFFLGFVNPGVLAASGAVIFLSLFLRKWRDKDFVLLAVVLFSAVFFTRGVVLSDGVHLIFGSSYISLALMLSVEKLTELHLRGRAFRYLPALSAAGALFVMFYMPVKTLAKHEFIPGYPYKQLIYPASAQSLRTDRIGDVVIDEFQAKGINDLLDFFGREEGEGEYIFDFTNNYGLSIWILNKRPVTKALDMALYGTAESQKYVIERLAAKRPRFVLFNSNDPYSKYLDIYNSIRYPLVAKYIFENYAPYARALNYHIMARKDFISGRPEQKRTKIHEGPMVSGVVDENASGVEVTLPAGANSYKNRYMAIVMKVVGDDGNYQEEGIHLLNKVRVASVVMTGASTAGSKQLVTYRFKLKNSEEPVEYIIPIPDSDVKLLTLYPANFRCSYSIERLEVFSAERSQYPGTLRDWDMFESTELEHLPYFMAGNADKIIGGRKPLLRRLLGQTGAVEAKGIDFPAERVSYILLEVESKWEGRGSLMWDAGHGYFKDQAVHFKLKSDGRPHGYLIDLSSIPSWRYGGHIKNLKISSVPGTGHLWIRKIMLF